MSIAHLNFYYQMDSLRKRTSMDIKRVPSAGPAFRTSKNLPQKEEIFIPRQETQQPNGKFEKKLNKKKKKKGIGKMILIIFLFLLTSIILYLGYFSWKTISTAKKINVTENSNPLTLAENVKAIISPIVPSAAIPLRGENEGRINILLLGAAGEKDAGKNLTDTIMLMSVDTKNKKAALLSLPRDLYVKIPKTQTSTKINSVYKIGLTQDLGIDPIKETVEKITGIPVNYYLVVNFDAFEKIINDIGGINITSELDIYDTTYPGPNYSYETFSLSKGFHTLDGSTALKYVRERHSDPEGDFGRAKRQQQVIQAVKSKLFSMETFFNVSKLNDILNTLGDNVKTDIPPEEIGSFINLSKNVDTQNINNVVVDAWKSDSLLKVSHIAVGNVMAFILVPRVGNFSEIQELAQNIFDQAELKKRAQAIKAEGASIEIINKSNNIRLANNIKEMLTKNLDFKDVILSEGEKNDIVEHTLLFDNSNGAKIFTEDELIKKLPATLSSEKLLADSKANLVIVLGEDLINTYKFETDSIEDYNKAQDSQDNIDFTQIK